MADTRTHFIISAGTWVKVVDGVTSASIHRVKLGPKYVSMLYDNVADAPTNGVFPLTSQPIFTESDTEIVSYPVAVYEWVACRNVLETGEVIVA